MHQRPCLCSKSCTAHTHAHTRRGLASPNAEKQLAQQTAVTTTPGLARTAATTLTMKTSTIACTYTQVSTPYLHPIQDQAVQDTSVGDGERSVPGGVHRLQLRDKDATHNAPCSSTPVSTMMLRHTKTTPSGECSGLARPPCWSRTRCRSCPRRAWPRGHRSTSPPECRLCFLR